MQNNVTNIPDALLQSGMTLFRCTEGELRRNVIRSEVFSYAGTRLVLAAYKGDNTLERLRNEMGHDHYGLHRIPTSARGIVLDFGANVGDFSIATALQRPFAQIVAVEPVPQQIWFMRLNLFLNNVTEMSCSDVGSSFGRGVCVLNRAITHHHAGLAYNGDVEVNFDLGNTQNAAIRNPLLRDTYAHWSGKDVPRLRKDRFPPYSQKTSTLVRAASARDFLIPFVPVLLLKFDCEGCEFDLLPSLHDELFNRTKIHWVGGELHLSLIPKRTGREQRLHSRQRSLSEVDATFAALRRRGCPTSTWRILCERCERR